MPYSTSPPFLNTAYITTLTSPRIARVRAAPARFYDEQAALVELAQLAAAERNPAATYITDTSDSEEEEEEKGGMEVDEHKESQVRTSSFPWMTQHTPVDPLAFLLPRQRPRIPHHCNTSMQFFQLFFDDHFFHSIVNMTNAYAEQQMNADKENDATAVNNAAAASERDKQWRPTTIEEVKAFIGCLIYMGIACMDATRDYWAALTRQSFVADCFPRDRFLALLSHVRVSEQKEEEAAAVDQLGKLRQLITTLDQQLLHYFYPGRELCIDEAMVAFKGRSIMRQHIAKKRSPTGFKVWMMVDCTTNYVVAFDIFTGMKGKKREEGAAGRVVMDLVSRVQSDRYHVIGMDGYFSSVKLLEELLEKGFYAVATTRHNRRHFPKELLHEIEGKQRGEWVWRQKQGSSLIVTSYMDKKPVNLISTCADPTKTASVRRRTGNEVKDIPCPEVLPMYLKCMRGVDVFAQRQSYCKIGRRSVKWFYSLVWFLFDIGIHNAFILHQQKHHKKNYDEKAFRKELMVALVNGYSCVQGKGNSAAPLKRVRDIFHTVQHSHQQGTCHHCRRRVGNGGHNARSYWKCAECDVFLCMPKCYNTHVQTLANIIQQEERDE